MRLRSAEIAIISREHIKWVELEAGVSGVGMIFFNSKLFWSFAPQPKIFLKLFASRTQNFEQIVNFEQ